MTREALLARTLVRLADTLVDEFDVIDLLTLLADRCVEVLNVDAAGIMLADADGRLRVMASSSEATRVLELFEIEAREGPSLEAHRTGVPVVNQNVAHGDSPWPRLAAEALATGFHSVHALPMRLRGSVIGVLNLFRVGLGEMELSDVEVAQAFADVATIAVLQHRAAQEAEMINAQLTNALNSRIVIEQAKGMIAERLNIDIEMSFDMLRAYARNYQKPLVDVAESILDGTLPVSATPPARS
jgi:GAF domain-containing protein